MCVDGVCRDHPAIAALPHGTQSMDAFLYNLLPYPSKTLEGAATDHNLHLLRRLLSDATSGRNTTCTDRLSCKPITAPQHPFLLSIHILKAALIATQQGSPQFKRLLKCLHAVNLPAVSTNEVFAKPAARAAWRSSSGCMQTVHAIRSSLTRVRRE